MSGKITATAHLLVLYVAVNRQKWIGADGVVQRWTERVKCVTVEQLDIIQDLHRAYNDADDVMIMLEGIVAKGGGTLCDKCATALLPSGSVEAKCDRELATRLLKVARGYSNELHCKFSEITVVGVEEE